MNKYVEAKSKCEKIYCHNCPLHTFISEESECKKFFKKMSYERSVSPFYEVEYEKDKFTFTFVYFRNLIFYQADGESYLLILEEEISDFKNAIEEIAVINNLKNDDKYTYKILNSYLRVGRQK